MPEVREASFRSFLSSYDGDSSEVDTPHILQGPIAFLVSPFDGAALQFSFPLRIHRNLLDEIDLGAAGSDEAVCALIEYIKERRGNGAYCDAQGYYLFLFQVVNNVHYSA